MVGLLDDVNVLGASVLCTHTRLKCKILCYVYFTTIKKKKQSSVSVSVGFQVCLRLSLTLTGMFLAAPGAPAGNAETVQGCHVPLVRACLVGSGRLPPT